MSDHAEIRSFLKALAIAGRGYSPDARDRIMAVPLASGECVLRVSDLDSLLAENENQHTQIMSMAADTVRMAGDIFVLRKVAIAAREVAVRVRYQGDVSPFIDDAIKAVESTLDELKVHGASI